MKYKIFLLLLISNFYIKPDNSNLSAVTYTFSGGRFGDNLIAYLHAKWVSYKYDIPLLYKPFQYSDQLVLHEREKHYNAKELGQFRKYMEFRRGDNLNINRNSQTLYVIPYFAESLEEYKNPHTGTHPINFTREIFFYFKVDWKDKLFLKQIRELVKIKTNFNLIVPPKDCISLAVHVRKNGGGYDNMLLDGLAVEKYDPSFVYLDLAYPLKCASDSYYIEQIKKVAQIFKDQKIYVFIFTDDPNPEAIAVKYKNVINNDQLVFDYRKTDNKYNINVLEDFFSLLNFDCFIRNDSNFSLAASKLGSYKVHISPEHHKWEGRNLIIDKVNIEMNLIPKKIHQIWIGPKPLPEKFSWMQESIKKIHPDWEYKLWTNKDLKDFKLQNREIFNKVTNIGAKADIFRYEILERFGGIYIDIDFELLKPLDDLIVNYEFFGCLLCGTELVSNGIIGSRTNHPILQECIRRVSEINQFDNKGDNTTVLNMTGPYFFTDIINRYVSRNNDQRLKILSSDYFFPFPATQRESFWNNSLNRANVLDYIKPETLGIHYWATSWQD